MSLGNYHSLLRIQGSGPMMKDDIEDHFRHYGRDGQIFMFQAEGSEPVYVIGHPVAKIPIQEVGYPQWMIDMLLQGPGSFASGYIEMLSE